MANSILGQVASVGDSGQLVTDIANDNVASLPSDDTVQVKFAGHETIGLYPTEHGQPDSTMVASRGASGFVEIEIVGISLSDMLGIKPGESVEVVWT